MRKTIFIIIGCVAIVSFVIVCCEWRERGKLEDAYNLEMKRSRAKSEEKIEEDAKETVADGVKNSDTTISLVDRLAKAEALDGWIGSCPWVKWESERYCFSVQYPYFMDVNHKLTDESCIYLEWDLLRMIGKIYENSMPVNEKYEALKSGANTTSVGDDYILLAGRISKDMRFFEKNIKKGRHWYYLRVEFPLEYTTAIDPLLQYVKDYYPCDSSYVITR